MMRAALVSLALILPSTAVAQDVTAVLEPLRSVELRSTVNGRVTELVELEGTRVAAGDVLAEVDAVVQQARVDLAKVVAEADSSVRRAEELLKQAEFRLTRIARARERGAAQSWEVETAEQAVSIAQADIAVARDEQQRRVAELELELATLSEFTVLAPFDATVLNVAVDPGTIVDTATVLLEIGALDTLQATAFVPVDWAPALRASEAIDATLENGGRVEAQVRAVDPRVDPASRTIRLLVEVPNSDGALRPGEILVIKDPR